MKKHVHILGGYGNTGKLIAGLLLQETDVHITLSGRNIKKARDMAAELNDKFQGMRVTAKSADAADLNSLKDAFTGADLAVIASSTLDFVENVVRAAVETKTDYLDTQLSTPHKHDILKSYLPGIKESGLTFITDGGFHPGVPAALVRYAAEQFDKLDTANVFSAVKINWKAFSFSESTVMEMVEEFKNFKTIVLKNGQWTKTKWSEYKKFDFGQPVGKTGCYPMFLEELRELPELLPELRETGFFISGFNWFVDYIATPVTFAGLSVLPQKHYPILGKFFKWGLQTFSKPPYITKLVLNAGGLKDDKNKTLTVQLSHSNGYFLTAVPVAACLKQYLSGAVRNPGVWFQANIVKPELFLKDINRMGIKLNIKTNENQKA
ncbi:saccharopine dehydrogenase NADP-binding domain-containing protein [candidate division KSB1 bacterium]|nr:saccharopine dehydrogenase NADP-binding domain-containing protein [candidate division KSB1 bacterium]